jgi:hypothetical protein
MTSQRGSTGGQDPMRAGSQLFEAGYQQLFEGWKQAQEFWNGMARTWGGAAGAWMQQGAGSNESMEVLRELNESALAVAQAWMRMPMVMMGGANPTELQEAITRLTQAQGRAYQLWLEALSRTGSSAAGTARQAAKEMEKK